MTGWDTTTTRECELAASSFSCDVVGLAPHGCMCWLLGHSHALRQRSNSPSHNVELWTNETLAFLDQVERRRDGGGGHEVCSSVVAVRPGRVVGCQRLVAFDTRCPQHHFSHRAHCTHLPSIFTWPHRHLIPRTTTILLHLTLWWRTWMLGIGR